MSVIVILYKTAILLACSIIQVFGVLIEGASELFAKLGELLGILHDKLFDQIKKKKKQSKNIHVPL